MDFHVASLPQLRDSFQWTTAIWPRKFLPALPDNYGLMIATAEGLVEPMVPHH